MRRKERLGSGQGVGIESPLMVLVAEDELSSLVVGVVDDYERPEHICAMRCVLMRLEERVFVWADVTSF